MTKTLSDSDLDDGLDEAKKKPRYFAIITKGQTIVKMIVQKKRIKEGDIQFARREFGGNAEITGVCVRSGSEVLLQVLEKEPPLKTIKVKEFITEQTGATVKPQWQVVAALAAVPDDDLDENIAALARQPKPPAPSPPYEDDVPVATKQDAAPLERARQYNVTETKAKNESATDASGYVADNFGPKSTPTVSSTTNQASTSNSTPQSNSTSNTPQASPTDASQQATSSPSYVATTSNSGASTTSPPSNETKHDKVKKALKSIKSQINKAIEVRDPKKKPPLDKPAPEGTPNSDEAPYRAQILELVARIKALLKDTSKDRSDEAMSVFRELVAVLRAVSLERGEKPTDEEQSQRHVELQRCRLLWDQARKELHARLQGVAAAVQKECQNEEEYDQADVKTKLKVGLIDALMNRLDSRLVDVLDQALNAKKPEDRGGFEKQAIQLVGEYLAFVDSNPLVYEIDESGLIDTPIKPKMTNVLTELSSRLSA